MVSSAKPEENTGISITLNYLETNSSMPNSPPVPVLPGWSCLGTRLEMKLIKGSGGTPKLSYTGRDDRHFVPTGLYIVRTVTGRCEIPCLVTLSPARVPSPDFVVGVDGSQLATSEELVGNTTPPDWTCFGLWLGAGRDKIVEAHVVFSAGKHGLSTVYPNRLAMSPLWWPGPG